MRKSVSANGPLTLDTTRGDDFQVTLGANVTATTLSDPTIGQELTLEWKQGRNRQPRLRMAEQCEVGGGGSAPAASTSANYSDLVTFRYDGTNWVDRYRTLAIH